MNQSLPVIGIYAAVLGLLFVWLSFNTIKQRQKLNIAVGDKKNPQMIRAMRAHANFAEYVPLAILLVYFLELGQGNTMIIHGLGAILLVGRLLHAWGISQTKEDFRFRKSGIAMTFFVIVAASVGIAITMFI